MALTVVLGDPASFHIKSGGNPHTRNRWGRRKKVDLSRAVCQWNELKSLLASQGVGVHVLPPVKEEPGLVFPANAGFRDGDTFYLSNLNPHRAGERPYYERFIETLGLKVKELPSRHPFEGEADFFPVNDPSGDPAKRIYLFTYGRIENRLWRRHLGFPPYQRVYGFRSSVEALPALQGIVGRHEILPLELIDPAHYHGDTVLCPFGPNEEFLLAYLKGFSAESAQRLTSRFKNRLLPLEEGDGRAFAANSFQVFVDRQGERLPVLIMPDGLSTLLYERIRKRGVIPCPVDVGEFLEKGGGAVKCMLLRLGEL